ncbi:hypothetical protein R5W24_000507 [Gemmata sp. JC717]|uniref:hypothetical protein n=1 Tax=Gemmata algarum TaxID=2975278 RepID=UPI0021BA6A43|nr:hypothetical protein [Gemmata algarum]MDY3551431.1 hypothetical protein [Gemmata algarum]
MLHHACLIKGWLLDKDPPKAVTEALEAIIAEQTEREAVAIHGDRFEMEIVPFPEPTKADVSSLEIRNPLTTEPDRTPAEQSKSVRNGGEWTPERRAAAAERMRKAREAKAAKRTRVASPGEAHAPLSGQTAGARQTW